ncbi:hypothetical protein TRVL_07803 [Trypanosoma vivax]|nr:hypothetical protein TRVL_07803 [Trypanosoma vivax]
MSCSTAVHPPTHLSLRAWRRHFPQHRPTEGQLLSLFLQAVEQPCEQARTSDTREGPRRCCFTFASGMNRSGLRITRSILTSLSGSVPRWPTRSRHSLSVTSSGGRAPRSKTSLTPLFSVHYGSDTLSKRARDKGRSAAPPPPFDITRR